MQENGLDREILIEISKNLVISRSELVEVLKSRSENLETVLEDIVKNLNSSGFIQYVSLLGESSYVITQKGNKRS